MFNLRSEKRLLYLIEILHQTTTHHPWLSFLSRLYLIEILHQTTTVHHALLPLRCCILSKFYIKPQPSEEFVNFWRVVSYRNSTSNHNHFRLVCILVLVVSYRNSTSNHNWKSFIVCNLVLYLIEILHQTTTKNKALWDARPLYLIEILHQTTTRCSRTSPGESLYLIEILHQTTTSHVTSSPAVWLYLIEILHQTTTVP